MFKLTGLSPVMFIGQGINYKEKDFKDDYDINPKYYECNLFKVKIGSDNGNNIPTISTNANNIKDVIKNLEEIEEKIKDIFTISISANIIMFKRLKESEDIILDFYLDKNLETINNILNLSFKSFDMVHIEKFETNKSLRLSFDSCKNITSNVNKVHPFSFSTIKQQDNIKLSYWDLSNITTLDRMFFEYKGNSIDFSNSNIKPEKITSLNLFAYLSFNLKEVNFINFDFKNVTNINGMFKSCSSLEKIIYDKNSDFSKITNKDEAFVGCDKLPEKYKI